MELTKEVVISAFNDIIEPKLKWNINTLNLLKQIDIDNKQVAVCINLITQDEAQINAFQETVKEKLTQLGFEQVIVNLGQVNIATKGISGVKKVLMVASGKGGVGKSNVAVNLAASLAQQNYQVGLMDADIYGPSIPTLLNVKTHPEVLSNEYLMPIDAHGIKSMSIGYLVDQHKALDWRGQMTSGTILQFMQRTFWGELDYLVIDLPPGTGDITLTIMHDVRCDGVLLVTTPSQVAIDDVRRSVSLFKERQIPIIGLIENMSYLTCSACGHENTTFPQIEALNYFKQVGIETLAKIPLSDEFSQASDKGIPFVIQSPNAAISQQFHQLAIKTVNKLAEAHPDTTTPQVTIEQNC